MATDVEHLHRVFYLSAMAVNKTYGDRSAYYQKAIKATARRLKTNTNLLWLFLLFGRLEIGNENLENHFCVLFFLVKFILIPKPMTKLND